MRPHQSLRRWSAPASAAAARCRTITKTETSWGLALSLHLVPTLHDKRLDGSAVEPDDEDEGHAGRNRCTDYSAEEIHVADEATWRALVGEQPLAASARRRQMARMLRAKLLHPDAAAQGEALHGLWELSVRHEHHADVLSEGAPPRFGEGSAGLDASATVRSRRVHKGASLGGFQVPVARQSWSAVAVQASCPR